MRGTVAEVSAVVILQCAMAVDQTAVADVTAVAEGEAATEAQEIEEIGLHSLTERTPPV